MMLRRRMHARQTKRTTPAGDISKVGRVLEQKYINYNFKNENFVKVEKEDLQAKGGPVGEK